MSVAESLGSHQLKSFAAFLEEKLHTSSETSIVQNPQVLKNCIPPQRLTREERGLRQILLLKSLKKSMMNIALLMKPLMARRTKIGAKCAFSGLNEDGQGNGGNTVMSLLNT